MKIRIILLLTFIFSFTSHIKAQDFTIDGINYLITATDSTVEITSGSCYTGALVLNETIEYNGIEYNITSLGNGAFSNCTSLTEITISNLVTVINANAFLGCTNLTQVVIPESLRIINARAFKDCTSLNTINIPDSITQIYEYAFQNNTSLKSISIGDSIQILREGVFFNTGLTSFSYPSSLNYIPNSFFDSCSDLSSVSIPGNITSIGKSAFKNCTSLKSIVLPDSIDEIKESTFEASGLTSIIIPEEVLEIGLQAFRDCRDLTDVTFFNNLEIIGINAFQRCIKLNNITLPNSLIEIKNRAFQECYNLTEIVIPNSVTTIASYAFYKCYKLNSVHLSNSLTILNSFVFDNCLQLQELNIPKSITSIESFSLSNNGLKKVIVNWQTPLNIVSNVFANNNLSEAELKAPSGTKSLYDVADVWKDFGVISEDVSEGNNNVTLIPDVNFEQYLIDEKIDSDGVINGQVFTADIENIDKVVVKGKNISDLTGIKDFTNLVELDAANNQIANIDLSKNLSLENLFIANNQLTTIDVSKNIKLKKLDVGENSLATLEVNLLTDLESLSCYKNQLMMMNLISNQKLVSFIANENQLTNVDVRTNTNLIWLDVDDNNLSSLTVKNTNNSNFTIFSATGNSNLTCIEVDNVAYSETNWTNKDTTATFSVDCAPANDDCSFATPLVLEQETPGDIISGNFTNATDCVAGTIIADVWYSITVPETGEFSIEGIGYGGLLKFAVYESCASTSSISCGVNISLTNLTPGDVYYLKVWMEASSHVSKNQSENGTFIVTVTDSRVLSVDNLAETEPQFLLYPNPTKNNFTISSNKNLIQNLEIYNAIGKRVFHKNFKNTLQTTIKTKFLSKGIYFVKVYLNNTSISKKLIIK